MIALKDALKQQQADPESKHTAAIIAMKQQCDQTVEAMGQELQRERDQGEHKHGICGISLHDIAQHMHDYRGPSDQSHIATSSMAYLARLIAKSTIY